MADEFTYLTDKSAKEERTYDIFKSEKDRKIWEIEIQNLRKEREAARRNKASSQPENVKPEEENVEEINEAVFRELINYLILSYEITKKFPVCFGKDGYYQEKLMDYINDIDKKAQEKEKSKEITENLDRLAFDGGINKKRAEKEKEAERKIDTIVKNGEMSKEHQKKMQSEAESIAEKNGKDAVDNIITNNIKKEAAKAKAAHKVKVRVVKQASAKDTENTVKINSSDLSENTALNRVEKDIRNEIKHENGKQRSMA